MREIFKRGSLDRARRVSAATVQQQTQRWIAAECFEAMAHDLRKLDALKQDRCGRTQVPASHGRHHREASGDDPKLIPIPLA